MSGSIINRDPETLGGTPVFAGTRVPVRILLEHFEAGDRIEKLVASFPDRFDVTTVQVMGWAGTKNGALLRLAAERGFE